VRRMRGSWDSKGKGADSKGADSETADSKGVAASSRVASGGTAEFAEMAGGIAMGFRVLKIHGAELINDRCCIYVESTPVV